MYTEVQSAIFFNTILDTLSMFYKGDYFEAEQVKGGKSL